MKIKAILTDYDGTLIDYDGNFNASVPQLIKKLQKSDCQVSVATGRACIGDVAKMIAKLELSPLGIFNGGGMILDWTTGKALLSRPISYESTLKIVEYLVKTREVFSLETQKEAYMTQIVDTAAYPDKSVIKVFSPSNVPQGILKILIHGLVNKLSEEEVEVHKKNILTWCKDVEVMKFTFQNCYGLDVTSEQSTKHTAVLTYAKLLGISPHEIVAIGDGYNDYPLFTACGYKIAMGNAPKELKEISDRIVNTAPNGGMKEALEHIFDIL